LIAILQEDDRQIVSTRLETFLEALQSNPIQESEKIPMPLEMPLILALIQNRSDRICRKNIYCPVESCTRKIKTINMLSEQIHSTHRFEVEKCSAVISFFIEQMFEKPLRTKLIPVNDRGEEEEIIIPRSSLKRWYHPLCTFSHTKYIALVKYLGKSHNAAIITNLLG
jgi:hypothetical protein